MKKLLSVILVIMMVIVMSIPTVALGNEPTIQPLWDNMASMNVYVNFSGTTGTAAARVSRIGGTTTMIEGTLYVYEVDGDDWIYIASEYGSSTRSLMIDIEFDATSGTEYVAFFEVTAHSATTSESDTAIDYGTCP